MFEAELLLYLTPSSFFVCYYVPMFVCMKLQHNCGATAKVKKLIKLPDKTLKKLQRYALFDKIYYSCVPSRRNKKKYRIII